MPFETAVEAFICRHGLLRKGAGEAPVVVGVSGGADSVALLFSLHSLGFDVRAAHCNFHLRGEESDRDMHHVMALCSALGVALSVKHFDVAARMEVTGESTEMACRSLRYEWFASLVGSECAQALAVGHHREDQAETLLLNLMRGTGPAGLTGMKPLRTGGPDGLTVVRPLLDRSRAEIEAYLRTRGISWITDSSNGSDAYRRNRIRHHLLPLMDKLLPGASDGILRTASQVSEAMALYGSLIDGLRARFMRGNSLYVAGLARAMGPQARMALWELLRPGGFNMTQAENILAAAATGASGLRFPAAGHVAELSRGILSIRVPAPSSGEPEAYPVDLSGDVLTPLRIAVSTHPVSSFASEPFPRLSKVAFFDAGAAWQGHWELRRWRHGDRMIPFGMRGHKLVSDIFAAAKLDARAKREAWLLTCDGAVAWIPGVRNSALFPVGPATRSYIRLEVE